MDRGFLTDFRGLLFVRSEDGSPFVPLGLRFGKESHSLSAVPAIRIREGDGIGGGDDPPRPTVTMSVSPSSIDWGQSATLTWSSTDAASASITPGIGAVETSGSWKVSPNVTTTYRITVRGAGDQTRTAMATAKVTVVISQRAALSALFGAAGGENWTHSENWGTDRPLGEWYGVSVDDQGRVTVLALYNNGLGGPIPPQLGSLSNLTELRLEWNQLEGPIPPQLGSLSKLGQLYLLENQLEGPIPPQLGSLSNLERLRLDQNRLEGAIPPQLGQMASLKGLFLSKNAGMSGPLPTQLTSLRLEVLQAEGTDLCAPSDTSLQNWLAHIPRRRIASCFLPLAYLTQAVQSRQFPVSLIAGEEALLRVFVVAQRATDESLPPLRARFYRNGAETYLVDIPGKSARIPNWVAESYLDTSVNAEIPGWVVQPGLEMVIDIDPEATLDPGLGVTKRMPESGRMPVDVRAMPPFDLTVIPFLWSQNPDSSIIDLASGMALDPKGHSLLWATHTLLPIGELDVKAHESVLTSTNNVFDLLSETEAIRALEGASGYYMGMMAGAVTGANGVAYHPGWSNFSKPDPRVIAHELGHNLSLYHAPCGNPLLKDPSFPQSNGSIGAWGYDFREDGRLVPPSQPDLMSYCRPPWISDYHFTNALGYRLHTAAGGEMSSLVAVAPRALLLWGGVDAGGAPFLEPAFVVDAPASLPQSSGRVQDQRTNR